MGPNNDIDAHRTRTPYTGSFSTENMRRVGDGGMLQWIKDDPSSHMTYHMLGGSGPVFRQPMFLFELRQNPNQTGTVVIEDVDEGINSQTMTNTLSGNEEIRYLATVGFDEGSREYEGTANLSSQNFQSTNMLAINTKRLQSHERSHQATSQNLIHILGLKGERRIKKKVCSVPLTRRQKKGGLLIINT